MKTFGRLEGEKLVRPPQGFPADSPFIELLKHKSYIVVYPLPDALAFGAGLLQHTTEVCRILNPFNRFLNVAVTG
ncbi:MAG: DUF2461 family protein [Bacteroidales bacterium]|nr:DUF2461 family protein [Bacteroidales bacterium]